MDKTMEPVPSTSHEYSVIPEGARTIPTPSKVIEEEAAEKEDDELEAKVTNEYFKKYILLGKGRDPEEKISEACKEIKYCNLLVFIAVGDYTVNKARNIQMVAKKWGLSFSAIQQAMSQKKEHSVGGRQYRKRKRSATSEEMEEPIRKSKCLKEKSPATQSVESEK